MVGIPHKRILDVKQRTTDLQSSVPEKLGKKGDSKGDTHGGPQEGKYLRSPG